MCLCVLYCTCFAYSKQQIKVNANYVCIPPFHHFTRNVFGNSWTEIKNKKQGEEEITGKNEKEKIEKESVDS